MPKRTLALRTVALAALIVVIAAPVADAASPSGPLYSIARVTSKPIAHEWPSINSQGTIVWSQRVPGPCQSLGVAQPCWTPYELPAGKSEANAVALVTNP